MQVTIESLEPRQLLSSSADSAGALVHVNRELKGGHNDISDIFGKDNRRHVVNGDVYPYSAVGRLQSSWDEEGIVSTCSGGMISSYHFLTAAHCVYNSERGGWADSVNVSPGRNGKQRPFGSATFSYIRIDSNYARFESTDYDYALVTLDERIGDESSWFGYATYPTDSFRGRAIESAGYPRDLGSTKLFRQKGTSVRATSNEILTKLDAAVGQSGSPVWVRSKKQFYIVGVLTSSSSSYTYLSRLNTGRFDQLEKWMNGDDRRRRPKAATAVQPRSAVAFSTVQIAPSTASPWDTSVNADILSDEQKSAA